MSRPQLIAALAGLGLLIVSWLFPPWVVNFHKVGHQRQFGVHFIAATLRQQSEIGSIVSVDKERLVLIDLCIVAGCVGAFLVLRRFKDGK